jgi:hypothetical protein
MDEYRVSGYILLEGQGSEAEYDFVMEWDGDYPNEMDVLHYMMETGIIQIIHRDTEWIDPEDEDEDD